jgi:hypothetical protein
MNDLFGCDPTVAELLGRIEALEAIVYQQSRQERVKVDEPLNEAWQVWNRHRNGKGWTAKARELSMKKLRELAGTDGALAIRIVHQSIENSWQALYPLREQSSSKGFSQSGPAQPPSVKYKTPAEALARTESREDNHAAWLAQQRMYGNNQ